MPADTSHSGVRKMAHWILVDYENVRPSDFQPDKQPDTNIVVFLGANQNKVPTALAVVEQGVQ